jgi:hypothetical protein
MDRTSPGSCPMVCFGIRYVDCLGSTITELVIVNCFQIWS